MEIIRSKRLWMRKVTCMDDYKEVSHGRTLLAKYFNEGGGLHSVKNVFDKIHPGAFERAVTDFDRHYWIYLFDTYIACLSEHDKEEDDHGRLSMWRAFGTGGPRVAMVFEIPWLDSGADKLHINFNPVIYLNDSRVKETLNKVSQNALSESAILERISPDELTLWLGHMMRLLVVCGKHEGFEEEREWRISYCPSFRVSDLITSEIQTVSGIPQVVHYLPLDFDKDPALASLGINRSLVRLIIGPTQYGYALIEAFSILFKELNVDPKDKVVMSGIPIRTQH